MLCRAQNQHWTATTRPLGRFWSTSTFKTGGELWESCAPLPHHRGRRIQLVNNRARRGDAICPSTAVVRSRTSYRSEHILFLDGNRYSTEFGIFQQVCLTPSTRATTMRSRVSDGGDYPGLSRGEYFDAALLSGILSDTVHA